MGLFDSLFTNKDQQDAANQKIAGLNAGYSQASDLFGQGRDALNTNYAAGVQPSQQLFNQSQQGTQAYGDALGLNGAAGNTRAQTAFQNNPGLQSQLDMGIQGVDRGAASKGLLNSGNTLMAEQQYGQNLGNQSWNQYLQSFQPFFGQGTSAAGTIGTLDSNLGNSLNSSYGNQGNLGFQTQTGIGNAEAAATEAKGQAANNLWNGLMSGVSTAAKVAPFLL